MPVLIANDSDPFAKSNKDVFLPVYEEMQKYGLSACIQTKGGDPELENLILNGSKKTLFYISLTSDDNDFLKRAEPAAPDYEHRLDLIGRAVNKGHFVVVGINPLVAHWWLDFDVMLQKLVALGVTRIWLGQLHLSPDQIANIPAKQKTEFAGVIKQAAKKSNCLPDSLKRELEVNFNVLEHGISSRGNFWAGFYDDIGGIETVDGFLSDLKTTALASNVEDIAISFTTFADFMTPDCLATISNSKFKELIKPFRRTVYKNLGTEPKIYTIKDALSYYWDIENYPSALRDDHFSILINDNDILTDDDDHQFLVYSIHERNAIYYQDHEQLIFV